MLELPHKAFAGGDIAVGFQPHAAVRLPAPFGDALFDFGIEFRTVGFNIFIELRLRLHKNIVIILVHVAKHRRKRALSLFPRMFKTPQPRDVDMRMSDAVNGDIGMLSDFAEFLPQTAERRRYRIQIFVAVPVDEEKRLFQRVREFAAHGVVLLKERKGFRDRARIIIHLIRIFMQIADFRLTESVILIAVRPAAFEAGPQQECEFRRLSREAFEYDVIMEGVNTLIRMPVHIQHGFETAVKAAAGFAEVKESHDFKARAAFGQGHGFPEPEIPVPACKRVA